MSQCDHTHNKIRYETLPNLWMITEGKTLGTFSASEGISNFVKDNNVFGIVL